MNLDGDGIDNNKHPLHNLFSKAIFTAKRRSLKVTTSYNKRLSRCKATYREALRFLSNIRATWTWMQRSQWLTINNTHTPVAHYKENMELKIWPLTCSKSNGRLSIGWPRLLACSHLYLHFIQVLQIHNRGAKNTRPGLKLSLPALDLGLYGRNNPISAVSWFSQVLHVKGLITFG